MKFIVIGAVILIFAFVWFCGLPFWRYDSYIQNLKPVAHRKLPIHFDEKNQEYIITNQSGGNFKILQLTDIHLACSFTTQKRDKKAIQAVYDLAAATKPDFIVITGDFAYPIPIQTLSVSNLNPAVTLCKLMKQIGIPWCLTYGNHDTEMLSTHPDKSLNSIFQQESSCLFHPDSTVETGRCNQVIRVKNFDGTINQLLVLLDSNSYASMKHSSYDYIHDDQVKWYEKKVNQASQEDDHMVSSLIFMHIPPQEFKEACRLYQQDSPLVEYQFGVLGERNGKVACSSAPSRLFSRAVHLRSTKAIFVGHDHLNYISLKYKGIQLTFSRSIDYLAYLGIAKKTEQRGGTVIVLKPDSSIETHSIKLADIQK